MDEPVEQVSSISTNLYSSEFHISTKASFPEIAAGISRFLLIFEILPKLSKLRDFYFEYSISDIDFKNDKDKAEYITQLFKCLLQVDSLKEIHLENNDIPKSLYNKFLHEFKNKGVLLFSCFSEEENLDDEENDEIDMTDLNK